MPIEASFMRSKHWVSVDITLKCHPQLHRLGLGEVPEIRVSRILATRKEYRVLVGSAPGRALTWGGRASIPVRADDSSPVHRRMRIGSSLHRRRADQET